MTIALITGGSRGLGRSAALHLARDGVDVIFTYRAAEAEAQAVVAEIQALGRKAAALQLDVANTATFPAFADAVRQIVGDWGAKSFDYLVNNAGAGMYSAFASTTEAQLDEVFAVHFKAPYLLTQTLLPLIADGGRILNISSGLARFSYPGSSAYASMKGAIEVLTRYQAVELGNRGIAVNVLAPGAIETDFGGGMVRDNKALNDMIASRTPLGRVGVPDDIGGAVAAILSPGSRWINGQRIEASSGIHA